MSSRGFQADIRLRRRFVPLWTQQYRLRHLVGISARNLQVSCNCGVFFTLHERPNADAFYTSEKLHNTVDPNWTKFNETGRFEAIRKSAPCVVIRIWSQHSTEPPACVTEWSVYFSGLSYIGDHIPMEGKMFAPNSVLFGLLEGYYGDHDCLKGFKAYGNVSYLFTHLQTLRSSYSAQALSRLKTTEKAIQQTEGTATHLREDIAARLKAQEELRKLRAKLAEVQLRVSSLSTALWCQVNELEALESYSQALDKELAQQQRHLAAQQQLVESEQEQLRGLQASYFETRDQYFRVFMDLGQRQRELIHQLATIYHIEEIPDYGCVQSADRRLHQICEVPLPRVEELPAHPDSKLGVALGYVCHMLIMLSFFLNVPLRYPISYLGSKSTIHDYISTDPLMRTREFPLFLKGKERSNFQYGLYLLNNNIGLLRHFCGLATHDLRPTLYNILQLIRQRFNMSTSVAMGNSSSTVAHRPDFPHYGTQLGSRAAQHSSVPNLALEPSVPLNPERSHWGSSHSLDLLNGDSSTGLLQHGESS